MATKPKTKRAADSVAKPFNNLTIEVQYWRAGGSPVTFKVGEGLIVTHREAITMIAEESGLSSAEIGERLGVSKKTVQGWRYNKPVSPQGAFRIKQWLETDPMAALLTEAKKNSASSRAVATKPERSESPKSPKAKA